MNGTPKGPVPYHEEGLLPVPVRVQLHCERPGRIHVVKLRPGRNALMIDPQLEQRVRSEGALGLSYSDVQEQPAYVRDGLRLARVVGGSDVLLARALPDGRVEPGSKGHACAGQNECRGKGWILLSQQECSAKGGEPV